LADKELPLFEGSEEHVRSYTYVDDAIDGLLAALHHWAKCAGEIFNIGTDATITTGEGIEIVQEILGKSARFVKKPRRAGDQLETRANISKARRLLGYNPSTMPQEGLERAVQWYQQHIFGKLDLWPQGQ
jgi:nucleoside-diphosphate-sugar epimerase